MIDKIAKYFKKKRNKSVSGKIRRAIRSTGKAGSNAVTETVREIVELAEYNLKTGDYSTAAENYDLAADAYNMGTGTKGKKIASKYRGMARKIRSNMKKQEPKQGKLEKSVSDYQIAGLTIGSFIFALLFLSPNLTGFVILNLNLKASNLLGVVFLLLGLIFSFIYFKTRKR
jgi:hypothetical protein